MPKQLFAIIGLLTLTIVGMAIVMHNTPTAVDAGRIVFNTCQKARINNTMTEKQCSDAMYKYKYEYVCNLSNNSPDNICWVESNDLLEEGF